MTSYQQRPGGKFLEADRRGIKFPLWVFAPGVSRGRFGVEIVVLNVLASNSSQQRPGGKFFTFSTGGIVKWNILLYDGLRFCWQAWYFSQTWDRKVELLFPHSHMQLLWSTLYDFFWRWIVVWGRSNTENSFDLKANWAGGGSTIKSSKQLL